MIDNLSEYGVSACDAETVEKNVIEEMGRKAEKAIKKHDENKINKIRKKIQDLEVEIEKGGPNLSRKRKQLESLQEKEEELKKVQEEQAKLGHVLSLSQEDSSKEDLIKTGQATPFSNMSGMERRVTRQTAEASANMELSSEESNEEYESDEEWTPQMEKTTRKRKRTSARQQITPKKKRLRRDDSSTSKQRQEMEENMRDSNEMISTLQSTTSSSSITDISANEEEEEEVSERREEDEIEPYGLDENPDEIDIDEYLDYPDFDAEANEHTKRDRTYKIGEDEVMFDGGYRMPGALYDKLFVYQQTAVQWLWELHCQNAGGIIGDEMGLGKTVQIAAFLHGLHYSKMRGPILVVCPATVIKQWLREIHTWASPFWVGILHGSCTQRKYFRKLVKKIIKYNGVLITTYQGVRINQKILVNENWDYVILDEGHKIRNPDAEITLACKRFHSPHRIILTGTPIQNNLIELWSLYDFVFPGKLGTLPVFEAEFSVPITLGGYSNASAIQVHTAYKCACVLRDLISPYLLRRMKRDINHQLPKKKEQVLFCKLTPLQVAHYRRVIDSNEVSEAISGNRQVFQAVIVLRKICNHPDLLRYFDNEKPTDYGSIQKSGKMIVLDQILHMWYKQGHKVLLFSQTRQMLDILEQFIHYRGYSSLRMDGNTPIYRRSNIVDSFNNDNNIFVFLLTTKVGGIGVNLTGANRIIIFDPDWNPSTDIQARERAWRLGQKREVTVYRLMTSGTIEEKMYHRQIFKQFLTDKILKDPRQRRFFKANELRDLFTLGPEYASQNLPAVPESSLLFAESGGEITLEDIKRQREEETSNSGNVGISENQQNVEQENRNIRNEENQGEGGFLPEDSTNNNNEEKQFTTEDKEAENGASLPSSDMFTVEDYKGDEEENDSEKQEQNNETENENEVLQQLFETAGVSSAFSHDQITSFATNERFIVDREASRVAERAASALRQSRKHCSQYSVGTPTWTGRSGRAGAPATRSGPRFGKQKSNVAKELDVSSDPLSSSVLEFSKPKPVSPATPNSTSKSKLSSSPSSQSIIARMRERKERDNMLAKEKENRRHQRNARPRAGSSSSNRNGNKDKYMTKEMAETLLQDGTQESLIVKIQNYLKEHPDSSSHDLATAFQEDTNGEKVLIFKRMLNKIAAFNKNTKKWNLKPEFK